ncbi:MAG: hypothetical protein QOJ68_249 [Blastococcus sp.]|nr:hypothetical protein [Blastococcus sp.]
MAISARYRDRPSSPGVLNDDGVFRGNKRHHVPLGPHGCGTVAVAQPPVDCVGVLPIDESDGTFALVSVAVSCGVPVLEFDGSEQPVNPPIPPLMAATLSSATRVRRIRMTPA